MTDITCNHRNTAATTTGSIFASLGRTVGAVREWLRRYRSRRELALYSLHERADLGFAASLDDEIAKPFWRE